MKSYAKVESIKLKPITNPDFDNVKAFRHHMNLVSTAEFIRSYSTQLPNNKTISQSYVSKLKKVNATNISTIEKIANAFGVPVLDYIASGYPDTNSRCTSTNADID